MIEDVILRAALVLASFAGLAMPLGAWMCWRMQGNGREVSERLIHGVAAFGGGALMSAVALVLVPEGAEALSPLLAVALFVAGGGVFALMDKSLARAGGGVAFLLAMLLDFLPEAMALGAMLTTESDVALLLAAMIFLQNLPEGFAAFREMTHGGMTAKNVLWAFVGLAMLGPLCAGTGYIFLTDKPELLGAIMIFSGGGVLYLLFQDVAPEAHQEGFFSPALGAVAGFALGLAGHLLIG